MCIEINSVSRNCIWRRFLLLRGFTPPLIYVLAGRVTRLAAMPALQSVIFMVERLFTKTGGILWGFKAGQTGLA